jgi:hypothetical protein
MLAWITSIVGALLPAVAPGYGLILTIFGSLALNWLRKYLKNKYNIDISDAQFESAKKVVQAVEEKALTMKISKSSKSAVAITDLQAIHPTLTDDAASRMVLQAVAVTPGIGATGKVACLNPLIFSQP